MLNNPSYHDTFSLIVDTALLHLYFNIMKTPRRPTIAKRNAILVRYLKPFLKNRQYRVVKNEIRSLLSIGRSPRGNLEYKLLKLYQLKVDYTQRVTGPQRLYNLLDFLSSNYDLSAEAVHEEDYRASETIYILKDHIENGFCKNGEQIAPVSMFIQSKKAPDLINIIDKTALFRAELIQLSETADQVHIILHPC